MKILKTMKNESLLLYIYRNYWSINFDFISLLLERILVIL